MRDIFLRLKIKPILFLTLLVLCLSSVAQENKHKWLRLSGKWHISNSTATETRGWSATWDVYELLNFNSIINLNSIKEPANIEVDSLIFDRKESPSEFMISFAVTAESQSWFYHMYAFKLTGGFWGMNRASFIYSDRLDKSKPFAAKNNTFVRELASADCKVKYNKMYNYRIAFEGPDVVLYINGERILAAPFPEKSHDGRIAISARNVKIAVDKVEVKQRDRVIFEDDFNEDSIYVRVLKVTREPAPNEEEQNAKKPE